MFTQLIHTSTSLVEAMRLVSLKNSHATAQSNDREGTCGTLYEYSCGTRHNASVLKMASDSDHGDHCGHHVQLDDQLGE